MSTNKKLGREQVLFRNTVCEEKRITKKQRMLAYFSLYFWIQVKLHHSVHMQISHNIKTFQLFNHQNISDPLWLQDFGCSLWFSQLMLWKFGCLVVACASCIPQAIPKQLFFPAEHCIKKNRTDVISLTFQFLWWLFDVWILNLLNTRMQISKQQAKCQWQNIYSVLC